jgi:NAD-dependent deacetylase
VAWPFSACLGPGFFFSDGNAAGLGGGSGLCQSSDMNSDSQNATGQNATGQNPDREIAALARLIQEARRAVVFTGAGISTESGIPDFRSPGGIWTQMAPIYFDEFLASEEARRETWRRRFAMQDQFGNAAPNRGHRAVDALVRRGTVAAVITQNIDGLHQASGIPPEKIVELHGNTTYATCLDCGERYEIADLRAVFEKQGAVPPCDKCLGHVKTATVSFGQAMPVLAMQRAEEETLKADLCIVLGSSLVVYPAAGFPELAKRNGAALAIVNREPTPLDRMADLVVHAPIGDTMGEAVGVN